MGCCAVFMKPHQPGRPRSGWPGLVPGRGPGGLGLGLDAHSALRLIIGRARPATKLRRGVWGCAGGGVPRRGSAPAGRPRRGLGGLGGLVWMLWVVGMGALRTSPSGAWVV